MIVVFKGDGPCSNCDIVIARLEDTGVEFTINESTGALFKVGEALGVKGRPIMVWASVGWGGEAKSIVHAIEEIEGGYP